MTCSTNVLLIVTLISSSGDGLNNLLKTCLIFINFPIMLTSFLEKERKLLGINFKELHHNNSIVVVLCQEVLNLFSQHCYPSLVVAL